MYYFYDMRHEGKKRIPLGTDFDEAIARWDEIHNRRPRTIGRVQEAIDAWRRDVLPSYTSDETRKGYAKQLKNIEGVFGGVLWEDIDLPMLREYLKRRAAKVQANRELAVLSIVWNFAKMEGMHRLPWPASGVKNWKNTEQARTFEVTDALFNAIYTEADQMLRDCMDISTATGMRLTDCRTVVMPQGDTLRLKASKTGKAADFDLTLSTVLPELLKRRRALPAAHLMLLSTPDGFPVSARMLRTAYDLAREKAISRPENRLLKIDLSRMYLRDLRKRASDLAASDEDASKLLQHSNVATTNRHYRAKVAQLKPVR